MEKLYELVYVLRPDLEDDARSSAMERVTQRIADAGGAVQRVADWGRRRMAYAINGQRDGHYVVVRLTADGDRIQVLRKSLALIEDVVRFLIVAAEPERQPAAKEEAAAAAPEGGS